MNGTDIGARLAGHSRRLCHPGGITTHLPDRTCPWGRPWSRPDPLRTGYASRQVDGLGGNDFTSSNISAGLFEDIGIKTNVDGHMVTISAKGATDLYVVSNVLVPGGHSGWHTPARQWL
jgi:hypothetical protein